MKKIVDIVLSENVDKQDFLSSWDINLVELYNSMQAIPNALALNVEEEYLETFLKDSRIKAHNDRSIEVINCALPNYYFMNNKTLTATAPSVSETGSNYSSLQFYYDTDLIPNNTGDKIGANDDASQLTSVTYFSRYTGKDIDIVTLEADVVSSELIGVHDSHPDFEDPDNAGETRIISMNWVDLEATSNNQISSNSVLADHSTGVLSAAAGTICGFAKKSNLRVSYITAEDGPEECINAIILWHQSKSVNAETGYKNPTILCNPWTFVSVDVKYAVKISSITALYTPAAIYSRPEGGWGSDFSVFVNNNLIPFRVRDPITLVFDWCISFPLQFQNTSLKNALEAAWDAGIFIINSAGNNGGVYVKETDPRWGGVFCTTTGTVEYYSMGQNASGVTTVSKFSTANQIWYPFRKYGPGGLNKGIDVAAGQNSETYPILDPYTSRGPGIDVVGLGDYTWTAYPSATYADGNKWGTFAGTSCAGPTVAGKVACLIEQFYVLNNRYPTNSETKEILLASAKERFQSENSTTWSNVPAANSNYSVNAIAGAKNYLNWIQNGFSSPNGGFRLTELAGTTSLSAFFNAQSFDRMFTQGKRPANGKIYPRTRIRRT